MKATAFTTTTSHIGQRWRPSVCTASSFRLGPMAFVGLSPPPSPLRAVCQARPEEGETEREAKQEQTAMDLSSAPQQLVFHPPKEKDDHLLYACSAIGGNIFYVNIIYDPTKKDCKCNGITLNVFRGGNLTQLNYQLL